MAHPQPPQPTELIYLPRPSWKPAIAAVSFAGMIAGIYIWIPYFAVGAVIFLWALVAWLRDNRDDIAALPRRQRTDSAAIPLPPVSTS